MGWLRRRRSVFGVETRRRRTNAGASSVVAELVITFLGGAGGTLVGQATYDALLAFVKQRLAPGDTKGGARVEWLRSLGETDAEDYLAWRVARAIGGRRADLALVEFVLDQDGTRAIYDIGDARYEVRADETAYTIVRVERPWNARGSL